MKFTQNHPKRRRSKRLPITAAVVFSLLSCGLVIVSATVIAQDNAGFSQTSRSPQGFRGGSVTVDYEGFTIVGPEIPSAREVIDFLHQVAACPRPHYSVPFPLAYAFAAVMEWLNPFVPWPPLVTRSIVHLLEETGASNAKAAALLAYQPQHPWREAIREQLREMAQQTKPMAMQVPLA